MYELILELMEKGTRWDFAQREIRIGRDPNCDLVLPTNEYPMVSRSHLLIRLAADRYWAEDLNTPGGTFVNGERIQVAPLSSNDTIRLGSDGPQLRVRVSAAGRAESPRVPVRRISSSKEAPTRLKDGVSARSSDEAPTNSKSGRAQRAFESVPIAAAPGQETEEHVSSARIELDPTPSPAFQVSPAAMHPGAASSPLPEDPAFRGGKMEITPSETPAARTLDAAIEEPVSPHGTTVIEQKLNNIRNLLILIVVLLLILGGMMLYQMRIIK